MSAQIDASQGCGSAREQVLDRLIVDVHDSRASLDQPGTALKTGEARPNDHDVRRLGWCWRHPAHSTA